MSKIKAVVLEKSGSLYTVLGQDGTFRQVHRRLNAEVGEEVQIHLWTEYFSGVRIWAGAVALFLLVLTTLLGWNLYQAPTAVALLSVDINPSIQFALDNKGYLIKFENQDEEAESMLSQIDLKGKPLEEVLEQIVSQAYDQKFLSSENRWVVVGYSPMTDKTIELMPKELNENQISSWVTEIGERKGLTPQVAVFSLTSQERELAQKGDLTLGEYALWQTADKAGVTTQPEKLKDTSERVRLLENPQIQVQIKAEKKERQSVLPQTPGTLKQDLGSIGKPSENNSAKPLPDGKLFSPIKDFDSWINKSRSKDRLKEKLNDQDIDVDNQKAKDLGIDEDKRKAKDLDIDEDKRKVKDQSIDSVKDENQQKEPERDNAKDEDKQKEKDREKYQKNDLNKAKNSEKQEIQQTKYDKVRIPQIPTPGDIRREISRTYRFTEHDSINQQRR